MTPLLRPADCCVLLIAPRARHLGRLHVARQAEPARCLNLAVEAAFRWRCAGSPGLRRGPAAVGRVGSGSFVTAGSACPCAAKAAARGGALSGGRDGRTLRRGETKGLGDWGRLRHALAAHSEYGGGQGSDRTIKAFPFRRSVRSEIAWRPSNQSQGARALASTRDQGVASPSDVAADLPHRARRSLHRLPIKLPPSPNKNSPIPLFDPGGAIPPSRPISREAPRVVLVKAGPQGHPAALSGLHPDKDEHGATLKRSGRRAKPRPPGTQDLLVRATRPARTTRDTR
jgi:hypothetical protein